MESSEQENGKNSVVDSNLRFHHYENLWACDLSVFPTSPAANPSLTLIGLAIRLADHLKSQFNTKKAIK
jgi:choline dehydrogenase-like flavoprotein